MDLVGCVRESVEDGLGNDGVREERVPVFGLSVRGDHDRFGGSVGDELVEIVGLPGGEVAHGEIVQD